MRRMQKAMRTVEAAMTLNSLGQRGFGRKTAMMRNGSCVSGTELVRDEKRDEKR